MLRYAKKRDGGEGARYKQAVIVGVVVVEHATLNVEIEAPKKDSKAPLSRGLCFVAVGVLMLR